MTVRAAHAGAAALVAWLALATGCGAAGDTCGPGTHLAGGTCIADDAITCGEGVTLADGQCVAASDATATDGFDASETVGDADAGADTLTDALEETATDGGCTAFCIGRVCGSNGCGGSCGTCQTPEAPVCNDASGQCAAVCVPQCTGKTCGDNGCGGSCGTCASGSTCNAASVCLPDAWTCTAAWFGDGAVCDCGCGAADADCAKPKLSLAGCEAQQICNATGQCVSKVPAGWTCAANTYAALDACNCGCGVPDPDCQYASLAVAGCSGFNPVCDGSGTCATCVPTCSGKDCGADGCGGSCGACSGANVCALGKCVDLCSPTPFKCQTATCGDDGCGGSCGSCAAGSACQNGSCVADTPVDDPTSCAGHCGSTAPAGCYCTASCQAIGYCCADYATTCACKPDCTGKACGSDGCGGTCGTCPGSAPYCNTAFQCDANCQPACGGKTCGPDGCGGTCGSCGSGATCSKANSCVPASWTCDPLLYGDKMGCDCGCGAQDIDCQTANAPLFGCPASATSCSTTGICDATFCANNAACGNQWCVGVYAKGDGTFAGTCDTAVSAGAAPGAGCDIDADCASLACIAGRCRIYCNSDADCATTELCVAEPVAAQGSGGMGGFAAVCAFIPGSHTACKAQANCSSTETCVALTDAKSLAPRYVCAKVGDVSAIGKACDAFPCENGQLCVSNGGALLCTLPCPAGAPDCPAQFHCDQVTFNSAGTVSTTDDPKVPVCLPN